MAGKIKVVKGWIITTLITTCITIGLLAKYLMYEVTDDIYVSYDSSGSSNTIYINVAVILVAFSFLLECVTVFRLCIYLLRRPRPARNYSTRYTDFYMFLRGLMNIFIFAPIIPSIITFGISCGYGTCYEFKTPLYIYVILYSHIMALIILYFLLILIIAFFHVIYLGCCPENSGDLENKWKDVGELMGKFGKFFWLSCDSITFTAAEVDSEIIEEREKVEEEKRRREAAATVPVPGTAASIGQQQEVSLTIPVSNPLENHHKGYIVTGNSVSNTDHPSASFTVAPNDAFPV